MLGPMRWWAMAALALTGYYVVLLISTFSDPFAGTSDRVATLLSGASVIGGLYVRQRSIPAGTALLIVGSLWGTLLFWTIIGPILGIAVIVGVLYELVNTRKPT